MKKILVPCDFSDSARQAYAFALEIAARNQAEVHVMKAIDMPYMYEATFASTPFYFEPTLMKELEEDAVNGFEKMKEENASYGKVRFAVQQGPVTPTILNFISKENIDLVIMGTHGTTGFAEYVIGSNTEKIVRFAKVPVISIRKATNVASIKNIVFPTTLDLDQTALVTKIRELQAFFGATLHLLLVNTPTNLRRTLDEKTEMEEYVKFYKLQDYTLNIRDDFYEQNAIVSFTQEIKADMIIMATHGRRGLAHLFIGSVTEDVVNHIQCPVWTCALKK